MIPVITQRTKEDIRKENEASETEVLPEQMFPTSKFVHMHTFNGHIMFLKDRLPNIKFNGYNREKLIRD